MASPPITIGELTDVPAPLSPVKSAWAQEVSNRVVQRFANFTALNAWTAANGSVAFDSATNRLWLRAGGAWVPLGNAPYGTRVRRNAAQSIPNATTTQIVFETVDQVAGTFTLNTGT